MALITLKAPAGTNGQIGAATYVNGVATVDDTTLRGKSAIGFATRQGWGVSGTAQTNPVRPDAGEGRGVSDWTDAELRDYLTAQHVQFPANASTADLRSAVLNAYEVKGAGGAASPNPVAGHTQGTIPVEGAPIVPGDDATKAALWRTPVVGNVADPKAPSITTTVQSATAAAGATATFSVVATGTPAPAYQWERQAKGAGAWESIDGADEASYTTPPVTVADNAGDKYRVVVSNNVSTITSAAATLTVTA